jgi:hypothetical protein
LMIQGSSSMQVMILSQTYLQACLAANAEARNDTLITLVILSSQVIE